MVKIVAAGKGGLMSAPKVVDTIVTMSGKEKPRVLYLGTPSYDKDGPYRKQTAGLRRIGCEVVRLDLSERPKVEIKEKGKRAKFPSRSEISREINKADVIMVSGGNTLYSMKRWNTFGVDKMLIEAARREDPPVLCGGSAGAICWFAFGHSDSLKPTSFLNPDPTLTEEEKADWEYTKVDAINIVPAMCVPHHDATQSNGVPRSTDSDEMVKDNYDIPCIGIEEGAAFVIDGESACVVSGEDSGKCYLKCSDGDELEITPLEECQDLLILSLGSISGGKGRGEDVHVDMEQTSDFHSYAAMDVRRESSEGSHEDLFDRMSTCDDPRDVHDLKVLVKLLTFATMTLLKSSKEVMMKSFQSKI